MISSVLLIMFNHGATGARYPGPDDDIVQISNTAFVDDVNTHHSGDTSGELLADILQDNN
jgi:hypothetical protein